MSELRKDEILSIKEFSKRVGVSVQAIYKRLNQVDNELNNYVVMVENKKHIKIEALELFTLNQVEQPSLKVEQLSLNQNMLEILEKQLAEKQKVIDTLTEQLEIKDKQISDYSQRLQEAHSLHLVDKRAEVLELKGESSEKPSASANLLERLFNKFKKI